MAANRLAGYPGASAETYESNFFLATVRPFVLSTVRRKSLQKAKKNIKIPKQKKATGFFVLEGRICIR